ncbi:RNA 3'-terminal phosphate cyclase [Chloroflexota bacterium]
MKRAENLEMLYIDGSAKSGSGTILRYAVVLSSLLGEELHINNIRAKRDKPGLRPQHLASVTACAQMCNAQVEGAAVNSKEIFYKPGGKIKGGYYQWEIGTAGSTTLLAMTLLPLALFADVETVLRISGGLFQDFAPSVHHMQHVLFPTLGKMGIKVELEVIRPGYVPRGGGVIQVKVKSVARSVEPLKLHKQGKVKKVTGLALSSHLREQRVSQRMAEECQKILAENGYYAAIETLYDEIAWQAGANLSLWAETDSGCLLGCFDSRSTHAARYPASHLIRYRGIFRGAKQSVEGKVCPRTHSSAVANQFCGVFNRFWGHGRKEYAR